MSGRRMIVDDVPGIGHEMQFLFVWVTSDETTGEGIAAFQTADGGWMPMVAATPDAALRMEPLARGIAQASGKALRLLRFDARTVVKVIEP